MKTIKIIFFIVLISASLIFLKISFDRRSAGEISLRREEIIAATSNKQILAGLEIREKFERERRYAAEDREFKRKYGANN